LYGTVTMKNFNKQVILICLMALAGWGGWTPSASGETTCDRSGCDITITIKMTAVGGDQQTINKWIDDIEAVWNGPVKDDGDSPVYGECECPVTVSVAFAGWVNSCSSPAAAGYHCIEVTDGYAKDTAGKKYRAYMRGVSDNGSSIGGWWSREHMNKPVVIVGDNNTRTSYPVVHDAAHEAGHMMGLDDDYNRDNDTYGENIMGRTWGEDAQPTQDQIEQIVAGNCEAEDAQCPDECCCGNGKVEPDKGEACDDAADPSGCGENEVCFDCECFALSGYCGDGEIDTGAGEECDPAKSPTGCDSGETCNEECVCDPSPEPETVTVTITSPANGAEIYGPTEVTLSITASQGVDQVVFQVDGITESTDTESPWEWVFEPGPYLPGAHEVSAVVTGSGGTTASDTITVNIF